MGRAGWVKSIFGFKFDSNNWWSIGARHIKLYGDWSLTYLQILPKSFHVNVITNMVMWSSEVIYDKFDLHCLDINPHQQGQTLQYPDIATFKRNVGSLSQLYYKSATHTLWLESVLVEIMHKNWSVNSIIIYLFIYLIAWFSFLSFKTGDLIHYFGFNLF